MKALFSFVLLFFSFHIYAQKYQLKESQTSFFSSAPLENIEAKTKDLMGIVDFSNGEFFFKCPIKAFDFRSDLMKEHFNENYMESEKFPNGTFKGKIKGLYDNNQVGLYPVYVVGVLTLHGVSQNVTFPSNIIVKKSEIAIHSRFKVKLADYKIDIPNIVFNKIAEEVEIEIDGVLEPMK